MKTELPVRMALLAVAVALASPATAARIREPDPFLVSPDSLASRFHRVAIGRVSVTRGTRLLDEGAEGRWAADSLEARLAGAGYEVVPAETVMSCWRGAVRNEGGLFDRRSGRPDSARVRAAFERMCSVLRDSLGADLWLEYDFPAVPAAFGSGRVSWDGVERDCGSQGLISTLIIGPQGGTIPALSLRVRIGEPNRQPVYDRRCGLAILERLVKGGWVDVPDAERMGDADARGDAVARALGPWLTRVRPAPPREPASGR